MPDHQPGGVTGTVLGEQGIMNIMMAVTQLQASNGGVVTSVLDMCGELLKRGHHIVLVADDEGNDHRKRIIEFEKWDSFQYVPIKMIGVQNDRRHLVKTAFELRKLVKKNHIQIIHSHGQALCVICQIVKWLTGVPFLWTNHIDEMAQPELFAKVLKVLKFPIISVSTDLKQMLVKDFGVDERRITVVKNGIDPAAFEPLTPEERTALIDKYNPDGKYIVSLLARMSYAKGHVYLLHAIHQLQREQNIRDMRLLVAGKVYDESYLKMVQDLAEKFKIDMVFLGFQNPRNIFGISDVAVLPSIYEGFGITVIEALAMGCPVIRSDTPGWIDTKEICRVFPKKDSKKLAEHLLEVYTHRDEARLAGAKGREVVMKEFTVSRQVDETLAVYRRILKKTS